GDRALNQSLIDRAVASTMPLKLRGIPALLVNAPGLERLLLYYSLHTCIDVGDGPKPRGRLLTAQENCVGERIIRLVAVHARWRPAGSFRSASRDQQTCV